MDPDRTHHSETLSTFRYLATMITAEISIGLLVLKVFRYSMLALFIVGILITIFSKKVTRTQKTGFWLDMAFCSAGPDLRIYSAAFWSQKETQMKLQSQSFAFFRFTSPFLNQVIFLNSLRVLLPSFYLAHCVYTL